MIHDDNLTLVHKYLPIIKQYYADADPEEISVYRDGYDHDVFLVQNDIAFRFPRTKNHGKKDDVENKFLPEFTQISPIPVQNMESHIDPKTNYTYQKYTFIHGISLTPELAKSFVDRELIKIAENMGKFLRELHAFPLEKARNMRMDELDPNGYWNYFEDLYEKIKVSTLSLLSAEENRWMEAQIKEYVAATKEKIYEVKVTHHDLLAEHIIVDEQTHALNGVIDFSLRIADPARDFEFLDRYGEMFLKTVYKNYGPTDKYFDHRRKFYAGHVPVINLYEAIEKNDKPMTEIYMMELKKYIKSSSIQSTIQDV